MPQIAQIGEIYASQLFWLAIVFGAIFLIVGLGMVPKIQGTVDARDARIAADLQEAASARQTADTLEADYRESMDRSRAEAARRIAEARSSAQAEIESVAAEAAAAMVARVAGLTVDEGTARAAVQQELVRG